MKPIELTEEQKSKLLEMCKKLFPEYFWNITAELLDLDDNNPNKFKNTITYCEYGKDVDKYSETIHWFEFCMEICQKLAIEHKQIAIHSNFNYVSVHYKFWNEENTKIHPIDYLYEQFLKSLSN